MRYKKLIVAGSVLLALGVLSLPGVRDAALLFLIPGALMVGIPVLLNHLWKRDEGRTRDDIPAPVIRSYAPPQTAALPPRVFTPGTKPYQSRLRRHFIAVDFETSGLSPTLDRVIEIGAVRFENGREIDSFSCLVQSVSHIPASATAVNHITDAMLRSEGLPEARAFHEFIDFLGEDVFTGHMPLVSHNAHFDMGFLQNTLDRLCVGLSGDIRYFDTLSLSRKHLSLPNYKQETVAQYYGLYNPHAHRAVDDARVCGNIMLNLFAPMGLTLYTDPIPGSYPLTDRERQICAAVQQAISRADLDTRYLRFEKHASGTVWVKSPRDFAGFRVRQNVLTFLLDRRDYVPCGLTAGDALYVMSGADLVEIQVPDLQSIPRLTASFRSGIRRVYPELEEYYSLPGWVRLDAERSVVI